MKLNIHSILRRFNKTGGSRRPPGPEHIKTAIPVRWPPQNVQWWRQTDTKIRHRPAKRAKRKGRKNWFSDKKPTNTLTGTIIIICMWNALALRIYSRFRGKWQSHASATPPAGGFIARLDAASRRAEPNVIVVPETVLRTHSHSYRWRQLSLKYYSKLLTPN